ncbi:MAG: serine protease [Pirellulaceae bacterium]|nr:MAG: serine protease [Pirellulaceae bacterium]
MAMWAFVGAGFLLLAQGERPLAASSLRRSAIVRAVEQAKPSVVNIHGRKVVRTDPRQVVNNPDAVRQVNGMGTGIIIDERGYILTNYHVVDGVRDIKVTFADDNTVSARLVAHDPQTDLALLKIDVGDPLPVIRIGTSSDLMTGEEVIAVGNAFGYTHTVTRGIISALHRAVQVSDQQFYSDLIQTDASINPGNSGGPLLNVDGEMIGINVAVRVGAQGIGFALPVDEAIEVAARLLAEEKVATVPIRGETRRSGTTSQFVVTHVESASGLSERLQPGDVILSAAGRKIERALDWERALLDIAPGEAVPLEIQRQDEVFVASAPSVPVRAASNPVELLVWRVLGLKLDAVDANVLAARGETRYRGGLLVTEVRAGSPAAQRGVKPGDILVGIHKWQTVSLDNVIYILNSAEFRAAQPVRFYVLRGEETLYGTLRVSFGESP